MFAVSNHNIHTIIIFQSHGPVIITIVQISDVKNFC